MSPRHRLAKAVLAGLALLGLALLGHHLLSRLRRAQASTAFSDLSQCLVGAPLGPNESVAKRVVQVQQTLLNAPVAAGMSPWPERCLEAARALHRAIERLPPETADEVSAAAQVMELVDALNSKRERRLPEVVSALGLHAQALGWQAERRPAVWTAPPPLRVPLQAPPVWPGEPRLYDRVLWLAFEELRFLVTADALERRELFGMRRLDTQYCGFSPVARSSDRDPVCSGCMGSEFIELERPYKLHCDAPIREPADLKRHVRIDALASDQGTISAALFHDGPTVKLYEPDGQIAVTRSAPERARFAAGHLLYEEERVLWARRIEANPRRLGSPVRLGQVEVRETWGESCLALLSLGEPGTRALAFWLGSQWTYRALPAFAPVQQFHCAPDRVVVVESTDAGPVRLTTCSAQDCAHEEGSWGELNAEGAPLLAPLGHEIALLWRSRLGDLRVRVGRTAELSRVPDRVLTDAIPGATPCPLKVSEQQAFGLENSAWFVVPACHPQRKSKVSYVLSVAADGARFHERPPILEYLLDNMGRNQAP